MTSPQRRVPLPLSSIPDGDQDAVRRELDIVCRQEQTNLSVFGSLTPRRTRNGGDAGAIIVGTPTPESDAAGYDIWKNRVFQPNRPANGAQSSIAQTSTTMISSPIPAPPDTHRGKKLYFGLQRLFEAISFSGVPKEQHLALYAFSLACQERNPMIKWVPVTKLDRNIERRHEELQIMHSQMRAVVDEVAAPKPLSEREKLEKRLTESRMEAAHGAFVDSQTVAELERRIAQEAAASKAAEIEMKRLGEERRRAAKEAAQQRKAERERRLQEILDMDEATREEMDAVLKVREKLDAEKAQALPTVQAQTK